MRRGYLVIDGELREDLYEDVSAGDAIPATGAVIVSLEQWETHRSMLAGRAPLGIRLRSDEPPQPIVADLPHFTLVALEFPRFRDGRAYSYARLLRERYGFSGELRAVGDVLRDQLAFMLRVGFDAFEIAEADPRAALAFARGLRSVWYQPSTDGQQTALELRAARAPS